VADGVHGGGVAGDGDELDVLGEEEADDARGEVAELLRGLLAVGDVAAIGEEDEAFAREQLAGGAPDGEAADALEPARARFLAGSPRTLSRSRGMSLDL